MKSYIPKLSDAEWIVMKIIWEKSHTTSPEIIEALRTSTTWSSKTIRTLIDRLVKKGAVKVTKTHSLNEYTPLMSQNELQKFETQSFIKKIYDGSIKLLVANFLQEESLTDKEIDELKNILNQKSK